MEPSNPASIESSLRSESTSLVQTLGADAPKTTKWTTALISRYTEPHRHYHTLSHIHAMLTCCAHHRRLLTNPPTATQLAIFFHDWIYQPQRADNETQSIIHFHAFAADIALPAAMTALVSMYIERTVTHTLPLPVSNDDDGGDTGDGDLRLFFDFDLEVLSRSDGDYALYAHRIRREYAHLTEAEYCAGRVEVLRAFLRRDRLYFSDAFGERCELVARENLGREVEGLEEELRRALEGGS